MKNLFTLLLLILVFASSSIFAGGKTIVDDVLLVYYCTEEPIIDGELDDVWQSVTATPLFRFEGGPFDSVGVYDDHFTTFRVMYDDDYFYLFVTVVDDELDGTEKASPWMSDCVEVFFDGGNEKASSYDANDIQWRWVYGEAPGADGNAGNGPGEFAFFDTESGYNLEIAISQDELTQFSLIPDTEIGFEISNADRDEGVGQQEVPHWWTTDGTTWNNPSLFGTALLVEREANSVISIPYTDTEPSIDGEMEEGEGWEIANELALEKLENALLADTIWAGWNDHLTRSWTMWDDDYFYIFLKVIDEERDGSEKASPWMSDCVELFIDGGNEKASSYDANDVQWRWVYGEAPGAEGNAGNGPGEFVFFDTDLGYNLEIAISQEELTQFQLVSDTEIGFEISNADRDAGQGQQDVRHWWTTDGTTWNNPTLFGTAILTGGTVDVEDDPIVATEYALEQNYPNPFNPATKISYSIPGSEFVNLTIYDAIGREVAVLVNKSQNAGHYTVNFNANNLNSGVYFYELKTGNQIFVRKMMLLK
jgi:hypothetical protein